MSFTPQPRLIDRITLEADPRRLELSYPGIKVIALEVHDHARSAGESVNNMNRESRIAVRTNKSRVLWMAFDDLDQTEPLVKSGRPRYVRRRNCDLIQVQSELSSSGRIARVTPGGRFTQSVSIARPTERSSFTIFEISNYFKFQILNSNSQFPNPKSYLPLLD